MIVQFNKKRVTKLNLKNQMNILDENQQALFDSRSSNFSRPAPCSPLYIHHKIKANEYIKEDINHD